jgi:hypothetical protein
MTQACTPACTSTVQRRVENCKLFIRMVGATGLEPVTSCV